MNKEFAKKEPVPDFGDLMSVEDFVEQCKDGNFIDYDGIGNFCDGEFIYEFVSPSDINRKNFNPKNYEFIVWFNK